MIPWVLALTCAVAASPTWTEVRIENLAVSSVNPLIGQAALSARRVDMDLDGTIDLVFTDRVLLQKNGTYDETDAILLPRASEGPAIDFYNHTLFLRFEDALQSYALVEGEWQLRLDMPMDWTHEHQRPVREEAEALDPEPRQPMFQQFVYDIDGDGFPELLFPLQDGLHIYRLDDGQFVHTPNLAIFPNARLIPLESPGEATGVARTITFPDQYIRFHCVIDAPEITIITEHRDSDTEIHFESSSYTISRAGDGFEATPGDAAGGSTRLEQGMQPIRLNDDGEVAYVGASLDYASSLAILTPIFTTRVQYGEVAASVHRTKSFTPHTVFTDVNHDGQLDLIQETTHIADGGLRETLMRFTTQKTFRHTVAVHYGQGGGQFEDSPSLRRVLSIRLDQTPIRLSTMFQRYQAGKLLSFTGDFDGDSRNDLLVQTDPETLELYLQGDNGLSDEAVVSIPIEEHETFHVIDVNGDRIADILFQGVPIDDIQTVNPTRVLLFRNRGEKR